MIGTWMHDKLKKNIGLKRYNHSIGVMNTSIELAKHYNCSVEKAALAGFLHDCGKLQGEKNLLKVASNFDIILDNVMKNNKELIHGVLGEVLAKKEYNVMDEEVLNAIRFHTTGREDMSLLEKIVYIADVIEPGRSFKGVEEIRELAYRDINKSSLYSMDNTIKFIVDRGSLMHLDTIKARNQLIIL